MLVVAGAALALIAAVIVVVAVDDESATLSEDSVGLISSHGALSESYAVGRRPVAVATTRDSVWVANALDGTVTRLEPDRDRTTIISVGDNPTALAAGAGSVWVANGESRRLSQIDPASNKI